MLKKCSRNGWATAQLSHNTMRNCIVTQQVLGGLLASESVLQDGNCIAALV